MTDSDCKPEIAEFDSQRALRPYTCNGKMSDCPLRVHSLGALPSKAYEIIYADPPWSYYGDPNKDQAAGKHYSLMTDEEIACLPVKTVAAKNCALFLWATGPRLDSAINIMKRWGFHYRGIGAVWVKTANDGRIIHAQGVRPSFVKPTTELLLIGATNAKGRTFPLLTEKQPQVVLAPRPGGVHSRKPAIFRDRIVELLGDRKRLEMFAREAHPGWDVFGNEISEVETPV